MERAPDNMDAKRLLADLALTAYLSDSRHPKLLRDTLDDLAAQFLGNDVESFDGFRLKGYLAVADRDTKEAEEYFRRANRTKPMQPDVVLALAQILLQDRETSEEGEQLIRELIGRHPDAGLAYDLLYRRYVATNRPAEAESILMAKVAANPLAAAVRDGTGGALPACRQDAADDGDARDAARRPEKVPAGAIAGGRLL